MAATIEDARAAFRQRFIDAEIPERAVESLALARPAIFFRPGSRIFEDDIPVGASKIGGRPDLPADMAWPEDLRISDVHLTLLAQINLVDVPLGVLDIALPCDGVLLAFAAPNHFGVGRVLWIPPGTALERRTPPEGHHVFPVRGLAPDIQMTLDPERPDIPRSFLDEGLDEIAMAGREDIRVVQLGGDPFLIQTPLEHECEEIASDTGRLTGDDARWVFVLQVDSIPEAEMMWGDGGSVYFLLRAGDLRDCRFEHAVVTMQCY